jgi:hypothetical protein
MPVISDIRFCNNLYLAPLTTLTIDNAASDLSIKGNFTRDPNTTFIHSNGIVRLNGNSSIQQIPFATFVNLQINNPYNIVLAGNVNIKGQLLLDSGLVKLGVYNLTIQASGSIPNTGTRTEYIVTDSTGTLGIENIGLGGRPGGIILFPVGPSETAYNPTSIANSGTVDEFRVRVRPRVYSSYAGNGTPSGAPYSAGVVDRTWLVSETTPGGSNVFIDVEWNQNEELGGFVRNSSYVAQYRTSGWVTDAGQIPSGFLRSL